MGILNFAAYAKAIEKGMTKRNMIKETKALLGFIIDSPNIMNRQNVPYTIDSKLVHQWWYKIEDIPESIKNGASMPEIIAKAPDYFDNIVMPLLSPQKEGNTYSELLNLIDEDDEMAGDKKQSLKTLYDDNEITQFLVETFLYAIQNDNKLDGSESCTVNEKYNMASADIKKLMDILQHIPKPIQLIPPEDLEEQEMIYVSELLSAYAEAEGLEYLVKEDLESYPKCKKNFDRQRKDYYAAETIRQSARDTLEESEQDEFKVLKVETYDGIVDVYEKEYANGFDRLNNVMGHVTAVQLNKSILTKLPGWIGASEKKGVCHMLVNDKKIKWVDGDDEII